MEDKLNSMKEPEPVIPHLSAVPAPNLAPALQQRQQQQQQQQRRRRQQQQQQQQPSPPSPPPPVLPHAQREVMAEIMPGNLQLNKCTPKRPNSIEPTVSTPAPASKGGLMEEIRSGNFKLRQTPTRVPKTPSVTPTLMDSPLVSAIKQKVRLYLPSHTHTLSLCHLSLSLSLSHTHTLLH